MPGAQAWQRRERLLVCRSYFLSKGQSLLSAPDSILNALRNSAAKAARRNHRQLVVLAGSRDWSSGVLRAWQPQGSGEHCLWIGDAPAVDMPALPAADTLQWLGRELRLVIYDCWCGLDANALATVAGTVIGGGLLVLLTPHLDQWPDYDDPDYRRLCSEPATRTEFEGRFLRRISSALQRDASVLLIREGLEVPPVVADDGDMAVPPVEDSGLLTTPGQQAAISAILRVAEGHSRRPLVLTADRGRGKSSALGLAAARLLGSGTRRLVVTAPVVTAVAQVFHHAAAALADSNGSASATELVYGGGQLVFVAADELLRNQPAADLLLVDEAAAIPVPILEGLVRHYNRVVFSTTVHGYEGSGRGFDIRFKPRLQALSNQVKTLHLQQPVRWAAQDPVERWLFDTLLLDASMAVPEWEPAEVVGPLQIARLSRDQLAGDELLLRQVFGLLVLAHYQTTPADLRMLLDGPNVSVWAVRTGDHLLAAALVAEEGGFDEALSEQVWRGRRRPRGHLLPQTLAAHGGLKDAPRLRYWRIVRIATHPAMQRRGCARQLMQHIVDAARRGQIDCVGSSFAASPEVVAFWRQLQFMPVRLGVRRDASSGSHSLIVLSALTAAARALLELAASRFTEQFPRMLDSTFRNLDAGLVDQLLDSLPVHPAYRLDQQDWLDAQAFAEYDRQFEDCQLALSKLLLLAFQEGLVTRPLEPGQRALLVKALLQKHTFEAVCAELQLTGRKSLVRHMRAAINTVYCRLVAEGQPFQQE